MPIRLLVALLILLASMLALFLFLLATDTALSVWNYLRQAPAWMQGAYLLMLVVIPLVVLVLFWSWFRPGGKTRHQKTSAPRAPADFETLQQQVLESSQAGVDVTPALAELQEQRRRKAAGEIHIAVFGEVSSGKSSLVKALLPEADIERDARAGTTQQIRHFPWTAPSGDRIIIADLPGFNFDGDPAAREETRRAHLVIFLCDSDLTASQAAQLRALVDSGKPVVLALNKTDRYSAEERQALIRRLRERSGLSARDVVEIQSGGREEVVRLVGEGIERRETREREAAIDPLLLAVQRKLDDNPELLESLRDSSVLLLASEKLQEAIRQRRNEQAEELISRYSKRAVLGAMAAIAPGSDLVIQGVLATQLLRELSRIYEVPIREIEIESFLQLAGSRLKNMTALTLAIAGNALKAFPGLGTVSGGVVHAVAYGMIFDSLGRAAAATLESRGELRPYPAAVAFEELMHEHLESGAGRVAQLVAKASRTSKQD